MGASSFCLSTLSSLFFFFSLLNLSIFSLLQSPLPPPPPTQGNAERSEFG
ncbi:hypothetical protein CsatB_010321 [Cannabis sativa]